MGSGCGMEVRGLMLGGSGVEVGWKWGGSGVRRGLKIFFSSGHYSAGKSGTC
jgi:hypothetical protein